MLKLTVNQERWLMKEAFRITGYTFTHCDVLVVELEQDGARGRGEASGVYYRGENPGILAGQVEQVRPAVEAGVSRQELQKLLPPGGARCALDCALWDLEAKISGVPAFRTAGLGALQPLRTTCTVSAASPERMAAVARSYAPAPRLKLKLTGEDDAARLRAVRHARPDAWIGVDANQGFTRASLETLLPLLVELDIKLIEQPVPVGREEDLRGLDSPIPLAADESVQSFADIAKAHGLFQVINIKLDKCGGLSEALDMAREIRRLGMTPMVGCMNGTSLSMEPAYLAGQLCEIVDLDSPMFLAADRREAVAYENGMIRCPGTWGFPTARANER